MFYAPLGTPDIKLFMDLWNGGYKTVKWNSFVRLISGLDTKTVKKISELGS
jgi:hypothetical protein